jgi:hypothetical protein
LILSSGYTKTSALKTVKSLLKGMGRAAVYAAAAIEADSICCFFNRCVRIAFQLRGYNPQMHAVAVQGMQIERASADLTAAGG